MAENYSPEGRILWDAWFIQHGGRHHAFYLQATPTADPEARHDNDVSIGHAVSKDLAHWQELPTALEPGDGNAWDNLALWTGSVIEKDGRYFMFYTGRNKALDKRNIQKIGIAVSHDLISWEKVKDNPVLEAVGHYHIDNQKNALGKIGTWRDPFVFQDPKSKRYYLTISAREKSMKKEYNGCVALAESDDLLDWRLLPPIFSPGVYDEIETTQVVFHKGFYYLFFSTHANSYEPGFAKGGSYGGLHCYYSDNLFGDYKPVNGGGVVLANEDELYDIRLLHDRDDNFHAIGWLNKTVDGSFIGKLSSPFKLRIEGDRIFDV